jgi:uncharacterized protein YbaR (Trm112 family)
MKRELLRILCCPICKGELALSVGKEDGKEVIEGTLRCAGCGKGYSIRDGIPDLLPPA